MNIFAVIVLAALLADYALGLVANILNLKALRLAAPEGLEGVYKPEQYRRSQEYTRAATRLGFVTSTFTLTVILAFWFSKGFSFLDAIVRDWGRTPVINGLLYVGILLAAYGVFTLPFSIYHTFGIEARFGFNRTTLATFVGDRLKGLALAVLLGGPLLAGVIALFEYGGDYAWALVWLGVTVVSLGAQFVAPVWIMPLFNKFTPLPPGELKDAIMRYLHSARFPVKNLFVVDSSRRSTRSNAFFAGFGRNKRIALYDTLVQQHSAAEIVAVLAHEVGHYRKRHVIQGLMVSIVHTGLLLFVFSLLLGSAGLYEAFYVDRASVYVGLLLFGLLYTPLEMAFGVVMNMVSRRNEYQADRFAAQTADPASFANALKILSANNLSNLMPHPFYVFLNYSHPPLLQRVRAINASRRV